jgi:Mrp family chromosome partitioning ATPase/capsular polysaccharide biosynthesis protein
MAADQDAQNRLSGVVRRHLKLVIALAVLATAAGAAGGLLLPSSVRATATVLITPLEGNPYSPNGRGDDLTNIQSEAQLVGADAVEQVVRQKFHAADRTQVSVTVPPNTQVLLISYTGRSATAARDGAQAFAGGYLDYREQRAQSVLDERERKLREQQKKVQQQLAAATGKLAAASQAQSGLLRQRINAYNNQLSVIDEQINDIAATPVGPGSVITPAQRPTASITGRTVMFGGAGLAVGLLIGVLISLALERSDRRLRDVRAVERLGVPVLSTVPSGGGLVLVTAPKSRAGEAYRRLRAAVVASVRERPVTLLVTNATPGASATLASSNLAVALAHAGSATIMIDASFSETSPSALFGLGHSKGLSDALTRGTDPTQLLVHADSQLRLLPRGAGAGAAAERFSGPRMREAVGLLRDKAEYILINAPSVHDANAQALCTLADAVLIVVTLGRSTRYDIDQAYTEAERAGAVVIGTVVEDSRGRRGAGQQHTRRDPEPVAPRQPRELGYGRGASRHEPDWSAGAESGQEHGTRPPETDYGAHRRTDADPGAYRTADADYGAHRREADSGPREVDYGAARRREADAAGQPRGADRGEGGQHRSRNAEQTAPDWSRFAADDPPHDDGDASDAAETAVQRAIEA